MERGSVRGHLAGVASLDGTTRFLRPRGVQLTRVGDDEAVLHAGERTLGRVRGIAVIVLDALADPESVDALTARVSAVCGLSTDAARQAVADVLAECEQAHLVVRASRRRRRR